MSVEVSGLSTRSTARSATAPRGLVGHYRLAHLRVLGVSVARRRGDYGWEAANLQCAALDAGQCDTRVVGSGSSWVARDLAGEVSRDRLRVTSSSSGTHSPRRRALIESLLPWVIGLRVVDPALPS
jgi:hypothetical protein